VTLAAALLTSGERTVMFAVKMMLWLDSSSRADWLADFSGPKLPEAAGTLGLPQRRSR